MLTAPITRQDFVRFVEVLYFGAMEAGDYEKVLTYFAPGATLTGYAGDAPPLVLCREPGAGQASLDAFMANAGGFDLHYADFFHYVDIEASRVASHFTLTMRPKIVGTGLTRQMRNCNFFQFHGNLLVSVVAYFCNPGGESS